MSLGEACTYTGGDIQTGPFGSQLHASDYVLVGIPSIMPQNIGDNRVIEDGIARITPEDADRLARYQVRTGDIVYSRRGDVERRALIRETEDGWLCGTGCLRIRFANTFVDPQYALYYLGHKIVREWIVRHAQGATMLNLNTSILSALPFVVPPGKEQRAIASILGSLDDKIELNRRTCETLEEMARAIFKSWFVDFDPVRAKMSGEKPASICKRLGLTREMLELFPNKLVESELGEIPEGWIVGKIGNEFNITMGQSPPGNTYNETGAGIPFYQGCTDFGMSFPTRRVYCTSPTRYAEKGDTLISVRAPVGSINLATEDCCIGRGVAAAHHKNGNIIYTNQFFKSIYPILHEFESNGTVFGSIGRDDFKSIECFVPIPDVISEFERLTLPLHELMINKFHENQFLVSYRDTLLPKLISGEIEIPIKEADE